MKKILILFLLTIIIPTSVAAEDKEIKIEKYYKTTVYYNSILHNKRLIETKEILEKEYNDANTTKSSGTIETTYKKMTTTISKDGSYYKYKNVLQWKNMPSTRSYDIIGIGFNSNVELSGNIYFEQKYTDTNNSIHYDYSSFNQIFTNGIGSSFKVPNGNIIKLSQTLYFNVKKKNNNTITSQKVVGDYSHATSVISNNNSHNYVVNLNGIVLNNSISSYYDSINPAVVIWNGIW